jgi:hypothetical protein
VRLGHGRDHRASLRALPVGRPSGGGPRSLRLDRGLPLRRGPAPRHRHGVRRRHRYRGGPRSGAAEHSRGVRRVTVQSAPAPGRPGRSRSRARPARHRPDRRLVPRLSRRAATHRARGDHGHAQPDQVHLRARGRHGGHRPRQGGADGTRARGHDSRGDQSRPLRRLAGHARCPDALRPCGAAVRQCPRPRRLPGDPPGRLPRVLSRASPRIPSARWPSASCRGRAGPCSRSIWQGARSPWSGS